MPTARPDAQFLRRWARRKAAVEAESAATPADKSVPVDAAGEVAVAGDADKTPAPLTDADMPPLDSLNADSDFSGFLSPGVSEELRRLALRKLFRAAVFNHRDGLDDYDDDFRHFPALGEHITSDMKHRMEMETERARAEAAEETAGDADGDVAHGDVDDADGDVDDAHGDVGDGDSPSPESMESPSPPSPSDSPPPTR